MQMNLNIAIKKWGSPIIPKEYNLDTVSTFDFIINKINTICNVTIKHDTYYSNISRCILYGNYIILQNLIHNDLYYKLTPGQLVYIYINVVKSENINIIKLFYHLINNLSIVINNRENAIKKYITDNRLINRPLYMIIYDYNTNTAKDPLTNVYDIINNYNYFEYFTDISLLDNKAITKINNYLGNTLDNNSIQYLQKLIDISIKRKQTIEQIILNFSKTEYLEWKYFLLEHNYSSFNCYPLNTQEDILDKFKKHLY